MRRKLVALLPNVQTRLLYLDHLPRRGRDLFRAACEPRPRRISARVTPAAWRSASALFACREFALGVVADELRFRESPFGQRAQLHRGHAKLPRPRVRFPFSARASVIPAGGLIAHPRGSAAEPAAGGGEAVAFIEFQGLAEAFRAHGNITVARTVTASALNERSTDVQCIGPLVAGAARIHLSAGRRGMIIEGLCAVRRRAASPSRRPRRWTTTIAGIREGRATPHGCPGRPFGFRRHAKRSHHRGVPHGPTCRTRRARRPSGQPPHKPSQVRVDAFEYVASAACREVRRLPQHVYSVTTDGPCGRERSSHSPPGSMSGALIALRPHHQPLNRRQQWRPGLHQEF